MANSSNIPHSCEGLPITNLSREEDAVYALYDSLETAVAAVILPIILSMGLIANVVFLYAVYRIKRLQSITNYYLAALALSDVAVILGAFFFLVWPIAASPVSFDVPFICWIPVFVIVAGYQASAGLITMVTVERYLCICHPIKHRALNSVKRTLAIIVLVVFISWVLSANTTPIFGKTVKLCIIWPDTEPFQDLPTIIHTCAPIYFFPFQEVIFNDISFYVCFVVNCVLYWLIIKRLSVRTSITSSENTDKIRNQVARMLIINGCVFFLCNMPARIINFTDSVSRAKTGMSWLGPADFEIANLVLRFGLVTNSAINPFIYGLMSRYYREAMKEALCGSCVKKSVPEELSPSDTKTNITVTHDTTSV